MGVLRNILRTNEGRMIHARQMTALQQVTPLKSNVISYNANDFQSCLG